MILKPAPSELSSETVRQTHGKELEAIARYRRVANYLAAAQLYLKSNVLLEENSEHPHGLDNEMFEALCTPDRPVIINFHGYPSAVNQLLHHRPTNHRFHINGYREEGTTTTPFDMNVRNGTSRYHLIMQAIRLAATHNPYVAARANERVHHYEYILEDHCCYIEEHGVDPEEIANWQWS